MKRQVDDVRKYTVRRVIDRTAKGKKNLSKARNIISSSSLIPAFLTLAIRDPRSSVWSPPTACSASAPRNPPRSREAKPLKRRRRSTPSSRRSAPRRLRLSVVRSRPAAPLRLSRVIEVQRVLLLLSGFVTLFWANKCATEESRVRAASCRCERCQRFTR